jgi:AcrR family transcriptional regulator
VDRGAALLTGPGATTTAGRPGRAAYSVAMPPTGDAPPRRRGRPPDRRSEETLATVLRAARERFSQAGYAQTSLADIADAAGVTPRALYHYAESKQRLFALAADHAYQRFGDEIVARVLTREDTRGRLRGYVDVFRALYQDDPSIVAFVSRAALEAARTPELSEALPIAIAGVLDVNELIVRDGVARGELAPGVEPAGAVALLEVFGAGLTLIAGGDRDPEYLAMLDVLEHLIDGSLLVTPEGTG